MSDSVKNQVIEVIADVMELDIDEIELNSSLVDDLDADSLDIVDLSFSLGKKFNIEMPKKSVIMHAEELMGDLSKVVIGNRLTPLGARILQECPNQYSNEEACLGTSLADIYTKTKVIHWVNLCNALIQGESTGDELIISRISQVIDAELIVKV